MIKNKSDSSKNINRSSSYNVFYWGPLLFKAKIHSKDLKKFTKLCSKKSSLFNDSLAGVIDHQHYVSASRFAALIDPYLGFFQHGYKQWYGKLLTKKIITVQAWVNFMAAGEFNPPHIHENCDFSSVVFVKVPKKLKEEYEKFPGNGIGPGALSFMYGEECSHSISFINFFPEEGDLYIFPSMLKHFVSPFMCKEERISMSANFKLE